MCFTFEIYKHPALKCRSCNFQLLCLGEDSKAEYETGYQEIINYSKGHAVYLSVPRVDMPLSLRLGVVYLMDRMVHLMEK
jgi:hypothetical protein